jgi:NAD(P)-dependent dehydrogenase (short-subunit alcohol dehydrogenase family)
MDFPGQVAVVTGGASGIGRACALALAGQGCDLVLADLNQDRLAEASTAIESLGRRCLTVPTDVSQEGDVERLAEQAIAWQGHIDILMNNAGVVVGGPLEEVPLKDWDWIVGINLMGPIRGTRAFLPHFLARGSGHIVNTASFAGLVAHNPLTIPYDTTKFGVMGFSQGLALYLRPKGIGVSVLCPGYVHTNLSENYRLTGTRPDTTQIPDRTVEPDELAEKVLEAIRDNRFLILSQPEHLGIVVRRWQDIDRHIDRQIEVLNQPQS